VLRDQQRVALSSSAAVRRAGGVLASLLTDVDALLQRAQE
jgi:hypothetical protein